MKDNWNKVSLFEIADNSNKSFVDGDWIEAPYITDEGIRLIQTGNIGVGVFKNKNKKYISEESFKLLRCTEVYPGDILICRLAEPIGRACIVPENNERFITSVDVSILRLGKDFSKELVYQYLNTQEFLKKAELLSGGSTRQRISRTNLGNIKFNLPPLPKQQKIAKILSTVDNIIEKTESAIAKYQAIKQGLMHDLFTRGIDVNTGRLRPTPQNAPELYKESVLGLIPKEWEEGFISEVVEENSPVTYGIVQPGEYSQKGVLLIRGKDYISGWAQEADFFKVKKELHNQFKRSTTVSGDILICIVGATYGAVGVVPNWIKEANITQTTARIRCNQKKFSPHFIEYYLKSSFGRLMIEKYVKGSAQPGLNLADVEKFITLYPKNINEQNLIGERLRGLDKKIQTEQQALAKYQQLKAGLLQDLLTGKVEVGVD